MNAHTNKKTAYVAQAGMIAAVYAAATLVTLLLLQGLAWGPVQFRLSEAVCVLAVLTPAAVPGLTIGCAIANLIALAINGTGALGLLDVAFGSLATFLGALWCWKLRDRPKLALLGPDRQCAHRARLPSPPSARPWLLHHSVHICCARWAVPAHVPVWRRVHGHRGSARHVRARAALAFGAQTLGGCPASSRITARRCGAGPSIARGSTWR